MGALLSKLLRDNRIAQGELTVRDAWDQMVNDAGYLLTELDGNCRLDQRTAEDLAQLVMELDEFLGMARTT